MKPFAHPRLWLGVWVLASAAVVWASLADPTAGPTVTVSDKWLHLVTYALLAVLAVQLFRRGRGLLVAALYLVLLGVGLEVAQGALTEIRVMDWKDAVANALGVLLGVAAGWLPGRDALLGLDRRWLSLSARER